MNNQEVGIHELIRALDEERKKVEAFQSELPLCLQLIDQSKGFGDTFSKEKKKKTQEYIVYDRYDVWFDGHCSDRGLQGDDG